MNLNDYTTFGAIKVHKDLVQTVEADILPGTDISPPVFWKNLSLLVHEFSDRNEALLRKRDALQASIDAYLLEHKSQPWNASKYTEFLHQIGYLVPTHDGVPDFKIETENVDVEVSSTPGPQLVVPVDNARYALNAANARWGSLLDAYYGTDAGEIPDEGELAKGKKYNPIRGARVFALAHQFLDQYFPLQNKESYSVMTRVEFTPQKLVFTTAQGKSVSLQNDEAYWGCAPNSVFLRHNNLYVELEFNPSSAMGKSHAFGLSDVKLESAITAICDCEDSVASVDASDKAKVYANWTGLMKGTLSEPLTPNSVRRLNPDKPFVNRKNQPDTLKGQALLFVRNVGLHMLTSAVLRAHNNAPCFEGLIDCFITACASKHDFLPSKPSNKRNSKTKSMYLVKPKMHGPEEVQFTMDVLSRTEHLLLLPNETIKLGIMDEERRTSVNLTECLRIAKRRCIFINTGFLDRTGDEIHTSFGFGPMLPKKEIENATWRLAYEDYNVLVGLSTQLNRVGQIGKGMWAKPDMMLAMMKTKGAHPRAGATTAWVPSPTAATLHAMHYHETDVLAVQRQLVQKPLNRSELVQKILTPPLLLSRQLTQEEITLEVENNCQTMLGYVSRWIQLGVGCSKVLDVSDVGLMEDRATLRISSQHVANWLEHGLVSKEQVLACFDKMAFVVNRQNAKEPGFVPLTRHELGFQCAVQMVLRGKQEANGLTERTLTEFRELAKLQRSSSSKL